MKRIIYITVISLFCGLFPLSVFSQEIPGGSYTGAEFLAKAKNNNIILTGNVDVKSTIEVASTLTLDLNGYALRGLLTSGEYLIIVNEGGNLTIKDSSPDLGHAGYINEKGMYVWPQGNATTYLKPLYGGLIINSFQGDDISTKGILVAGTCTMQGGHIMGCYSKDNGAAVTVNSTGSFIMTGGEISYNYAANRGGGIYGYNVTIQGTAAQNVIIRNNRASSQGGGIYMLDYTGECRISHCTIEDNYAGVHGGGIYSSAPTTIVNSKILRNRAMKSEMPDNITNAGRGGGFCFVGEKDFIIRDTEVSGNACMHYGGGGHIQTKAHLKLEGNSKIDNNVALLGGAGGLHVTAEASFEFESGSISYNEADGHGGGIHSSYECDLRLTGGVISNNTVTGRGGGVHINTGGVLELQGTDIISNKAYRTKDKKYCEVVFNQADATYSWNEPVAILDEEDMKTGFGGGVTVDAGMCIMYDGELESNYAQSGGGGIALVMINAGAQHVGQLKIGKFTLTDGIVSGNTTDGDGAGIYMMRNTMSGLADVPEEIQNGIPQIIINKGSVTGNKALRNGGGIFQEENTKFIIEGQEVSFDKNESLEGSGGAVYIALGEAEVKGGTISNNRAKINGGALYINGKITMTDGAIENNHATNGGGICVEAGDDLEFMNCSITRNTASNYGGGIYVTNDKTGTTAELGGGSIFNNNTALVAGGGLAVDGPITFDFVGSIQSNRAPAGGGISLVNTAKLNFNGGFIRSNFADGGENSNVNTGYHLHATDASGFGGGVFMDDGTTLNFNISSAAAFGFYGNEANVGGDDIFANANGTTVNLPDVSTMTLLDWDIPVSDAGLYWVEDYVTNDTQYESYGSRMITAEGYTPERYQDALRKASLIGILDKTKYPDYKNKYLCLALGYDLYYLELQKKGLKAGESAIVKVYYELSGEHTLYREIILVGRGEDQTVSTMVVLPPNKWLFKEQTDWSWKYTTEEVEFVREITDQDDVKDPIVFENRYRDNLGESEKLHEEVFKENRMKLE